MKFEEIYRSGVYLKENPGWHVEASPLKATQVLKMLRRNIKRFSSPWTSP
jgi:hypothetical protein